MKTIFFSVVILLLYGCSRQVIKEPVKEHALVKSLRESGLDPEKCAFGAYPEKKGMSSFTKTMASTIAQGNYNYPEECKQRKAGKVKIKGNIRGSSIKLRGYLGDDKERIFIILTCFEKLSC